jgi:GAG-pre-integrase domain
MEDGITSALPSSPKAVMRLPSSNYVSHVSTNDSVKITAIIDFEDPVWKWHRRLGHLSAEGIRRLLKQSEGIELTGKQIQAKIKAVSPVCATTRA